MAEADEVSPNPFYDALLALPQAVAVFDDRRRFVAWNASFEEIYGGDGIDLRPGLSFVEHLRISIRLGRVPGAVGHEEEWVAKRLARFEAAQGHYDHQLANGRWMRVQERKLPGNWRIGIRYDITELVEREKHFRLLFDANPIPMLLIDRATLNIVAANDVATLFYGYSHEQFLRLSLKDIRLESRPGEIDDVIDRLHEPEIAAIPRIHLLASGERRIVRVGGRTIEHNGRPTILAAIFDMTAEVSLQQEVLEAQQFLVDVVDQIPMALFVKDMSKDGSYVLRNKEAERVFGRDSATLIGRNDREVLGPELADRVEQSDARALLAGSSGVEEEHASQWEDGTSHTTRVRKVPLVDRVTGAPRYVLGIAEDVTDERARQARISFMAHHDALTGLPNRFMFRERLESALVRLRGTSDLIALLIVDLDGFKQINDSFGHGAGDELLIAASRRLEACIKVSDTVARLGGDEFAVLQTPISQIGEAAWLATRLVRDLSKPFQVESGDFNISASVGIAATGADGLIVEAIMADADAALYTAKRQGRGRFRFAAPYSGGSYHKGNDEAARGKK
jgi:diguanylate cyclase (GGDEF)-like protein/PAS domain S-box-containing protein